MVSRALAELADEVVVAPAADESPKFTGTIECFEDDAGVIGEAANNTEIDFDEIGETARAQAIEDAIEFLAAAFPVQNFENWFGERAEFRRRFFPRLALALVDDLQRLLPFFFGQIVRAQKVDPELPIANPNDDV